MAGKNIPGGSKNQNPRHKNGAMRRRHRARFKAMGAECGICKGRLGPIHYDEPSDAAHPLSFVIDEIIPISKYYAGGYASREAAAQDWNNLQAAHYVCNAAKGNKMQGSAAQSARTFTPDGEW